MYENFTFRLITQDRYYEEIFYPIGFIKRLLYRQGEKKFFDDWVTGLLDNIDVMTTNGINKLSTISNLEISNGKVRITTKNDDSMEALTPTADKTKELQSFNIKKLSKITLDHKKPLYSIMMANRDKFQVIPIITEKLREAGVRSIKELKKEYTPLIENSDSIRDINIDKLKKDLEIIANETNMQLMDSEQNIKKGTS